MPIKLYGEAQLMPGLLKKILKTERISIDVMSIYIYKKVSHSYLFNFFKTKKSKILFIVGCQRSGTSLMNRIFSRDFNVSVYRESSQLSSKGAEKLRLNSFEEAKRIIQRNYASLIVLKPLVESQNTLELLAEFPDSKALWMYRNYKDVAKSNSQRFGKNQGIIDLTAIVERDRHNWRAEKASDYVYSVVKQYYSPEMNIYDASALFWFARNQLFYELNLEQNPRVFICRYEELARNPLAAVKDIYRFLDIDYFEKIKKVGEVHSKAVGRGDRVELSPSIEGLCNELQEKLDRTYFAQQKSKLDLALKN